MFGKLRNCCFMFLHVVPPGFVVQPINITVQPINGVMRGAFSCSVSPGNTVQMVTWIFEPANSMQNGTGPTEPVKLDSSSPNVTIGFGGGAGVLILDGVEAEQEGGYFCRATLSDGSNLTSSTAYLTFDSE